ncbi:MAG TPA: TMEM175 family protein [Candidatus Peribacteraceae bacterium]|nr:TMEM175 family protein [Candidatus Peribacteraceae bacterium]
MDKTRLMTFTDGVIAIIITIMVLEMHVPTGTDWNALRPLMPIFLAYVLSFVYLAIYWNNHHHLLHATDHVDGKILWANMHLLFWLTLVPLTTAWMAENGFAKLPTAVYGVDLLLAAIAYYILERTIIAHEDANDALAEAIGKDVKGKASIVLYVAALILAFLNQWIAIAIFAFVALMWLVPDRRIERKLGHRHT